jgi:hypothetical protein
MKTLLILAALTAVSLSAEPLYILQVDNGPTVLDLWPGPYADWFSPLGPIFTVDGVAEISLPNTGWDLCAVGSCIDPAPSPTTAPEPATWGSLLIGISVIFRKFRR